MKYGKIIAAGAAVLALVCASFFLGRLTVEKPIPWQEVVVSHAEILERDGAFFHINGLDCNDVNGQGEYTFTLPEDAVLEWRYEPITLEDLQVGDHIAVTYTGPVLLSYPGQLTQVLRIQLLEDER